MSLFKQKIIHNDIDAINAAYHIADIALEQRNIRDQHRILPTEIIQTLARKGLTGCRIAKKYGGAHVSHQTLCQIFRTLAKADANIGQIPQNQFGLLYSIDLIGTEQQKEFVFKEILAGKLLANAGPEKNTTDVQDIQTSLKKVGQDYILNGEKFYSTGSIFADWLAVKAQHPAGYVALVLVAKETQGVEVIDDWDSFGQRTTASGSVKFNHVHVDPFLIFDERQLTQSPHYRGAYSQMLQVAIDVGIAESAFQDLQSTVKKARPIADANVDQASQEPYLLQEVGKLDVTLQASILLLNHAAETLDELDKKDTLTDADIAKASIEVAEAKIYAHHAALQTSEKLLELGGSRSALAEHHLDQHWRNARVHTLHDPVRWKYYALGNYYLNQVFPNKHAWI
ncbi:SfnB family sulfur acquisition oxidoreductase [Acinetobacter sp. B5B]|uniref:SfnB family sulfur acquisition oxidoreductase n=1 Tax=Acinetobacter baretiae TaxID=2605383 RepID=UPI0018C32958|nr:SfnB family sulfur acquisition oxidoreductase [Acinetobacter baretiae]MBF7683263.1 SfnB family sulfur acquisition oxidoreductase [Acinetobacter baretiae]MBF7684455.1 SfnB family sulfur acquisition oxidoreductase [Acinetobacter baretiae]